jgi:hypothetical protein
MKQPGKTSKDILGFYREDLPLLEGQQGFRRKKVYTLS